MTSKLLWSEEKSGRSITCSTDPSGQTVAILEDTVWGSRATRYKILGVSEKLARLRDPRFFVLSENGRELCVFVLDFCHKLLMGQSCGAWHFVMASTVADRQNEGLAGILIEHVRDYCVSTVGHPGFGFAYVETSTEFSLRLSEQIGYAVDAEIPLTLFSRLIPKADPSVTQLQPEETSGVIEQLEKLYQDHELSDFSDSLKCEEYLTLRDESGIVAGAQAEVLNWSVQSMPGLAGSFLLKVLPYLPILNRFLNLRDLRIVRFGNFLLPEGQEEALFKVMETALARNNAKVGLIMLDKRSPVLRKIRDHGRLGLLSGAMKGSAQLHIDVVGMDDTMLSRLSSQPLLVSAGDVF